MEPWLTAAVVDDSGRLLDMRHISDDPTGYAHLCTLLADRSGGAAPVGVPVAMDTHEHLIAQLLAAAGRPVAIVDEFSANDFAERFADDTSYDEVKAPITQRRAVGLARALQAGALYATAQSPSWDLDDIKPVLAAHDAVTAGRQAAASALRDVLRELYPAALRAYPDPADYVPLAILGALPEPGMLTPSPSSRERDEALAAELAATGLIDSAMAANAIAALRVAIEESPRWSANRPMPAVVAETVRQAVAAVRACDAASASLVGSLVERFAGGVNPAGYAAGPVSPAVGSPTPVSPAMARPGPAAEVPPERYAPRPSAASAAAAGVAPSSVAVGVTIPGPRPEPAFAGAGQSYADPHYTDPNTGYYGGQAATATGFASGEYPATGMEDTGNLSQVSPGGAYPGYGGHGDPQPGTTHDWPSGEHYPAARPVSSAGPTYPGAAGYGYRGGPAQPEAYAAVPTPYAAPSVPSYGAASAPDYGSPGYAAPGYPSPGSDFGAPGSEFGGPGSSDFGAPAARSAAASSYGPPAPPYDFAESSRNDSQRNDSPGNDSQRNDSSGNDPLSDPLRAPSHGGSSDTGGWRPSPLRVVQNSDSDPLTGPLPTTGSHPAVRVDDGGRESDGAESSGDDDLLIFSQTSSAWFTKFDEDVVKDEPLNWGSLADEGWKAAEQVARPTVGDETPAGLPRRVPKANLVPGSAQAPQRTLRIVRDARSIAAHTDGYFRGWRRGQEVNGFAVGQRDRAAWEFNREQRQREGAERARLSG